jgi:hypothetical protein
VARITGLLLCLRLLQAKALRGDWQRRRVLILAFASLLWFVLQLRWRLLVADEVETAI